MLYITKSSNKFARRGLNTLFIKKRSIYSQAPVFLSNQGIQFQARNLTFAHKRMFSSGPAKEGAEEVEHVQEEASEPKIVTSNVEQR